MTDTADGALFADDQLTITVRDVRTKNETLSASALQSFEITRPWGMGCLGVVAGVAFALWGTSTSIDILRGQQLWQSPRDVEHVWIGMMAVSGILVLFGIRGLASKARIIVAQFGMRVVHLYVSKDHETIQAVSLALTKVMQAHSTAREAT